ncbi:T-cell activation inhibitor, mitochondrial-like [Gigantopelta aegis]|uniref:T-cell activation inhibitor, mitochondrial-like n=1 Tax=Gigantopelta aegis TaxID=1735272 RepID=UPI001B88A2DA|nr:T-cell activation inhibitor, mitochondrial-like [Gigantopelta aegis]
MLRSLIHRLRYRIVYTIVRSLSTQETANALRPFYFIVHPDLFGQFPRERNVNEESLKKLHEYLSSLQKTGSARPTNVLFYVRPQDESKDELKKSRNLKSVNIALSSRNLKTTVQNILSTCGLPVDYLKSIPEKATKTGALKQPIKWHPSFYAATGIKNPEEATHQEIILTFRSWLRRNIDESRLRTTAVKDIQDDIIRICDSLTSSIGLADIRWDSVWWSAHFRGCLKGFYRMYKEHPDRIGAVLRGRTLVFSNNSGVSLHGEIVLSIEDVPTHWMKLLMNVRAYDAVLERLPYMEKKLSELLNDIQIVRRKRHHHIMMAEEYELLLNKLLNSLRRCQDIAKTNLFEEDLSHLELVVEGESGPLALSSTGQFLVPASIPGSLVIDCIAKHKDQAHLILREILGSLQNEEVVVQRCLEDLQLSSLTKDENITPQQMVRCCQKLSHEAWMFEAWLTNTRLRVSHYYSVMQDGEICIPWDWVGDTNL